MHLWSLIQSNIFCVVVAWANEDGSVTTLSKSLCAISYFGVIWELYLLDLLYLDLITNVFFCRKKNQIHSPISQKILAKFICPSSKVSNFWKKSSIWVSLVCGLSNNIPESKTKWIKIAVFTGLWDDNAVAIPCSEDSTWESFQVLKYSTIGPIFV